MRHIFFRRILFATIICFVIDASAQSYRYVDSSGNIHFVDTWKAVPREYREQIVPATPTPVLDKKTLQARQRERDREARDARNRAAREKQRREKELRDAQKKSGAEPKIDKNNETAKRRRRAEGDIEVIR